MKVHRLLLLVLNFTVLKCASVEEDTELVFEPEIEDSTARLFIEDSTASFTERDTSASDTEQSNAIVSTQDMFSRYLTVELFHMILQYVANSPTLMSKTSKTLCDFADQTRIYRFYEGTHWDMPELANVWKFGEKINGDLEALTNERNMIKKLRNIYFNGSYLNSSLKKLLNNGSLKQLAHPVLQYLVRVCRKRYNFFEATEILNILIRHKFYDLVYELIKKRGYKLIFGWNERSNNVLLNESFYFDYFNWAYNNSPSAFKHASDIMTKINEGKHFISSIMSILLNLDAKYVWTAFCIQKRVPESYYVPMYESSPLAFFEAIQNFLYSSSMINLDSAETEYNYNQTKSLIDRYLRVELILTGRLSFLELLNDIRFGPEDAEIYQNRILPRTDRDEKMIRAFTIAASKANKKDLVIELSNHPEFSMRDLETNMEQNNPHSFKVFFDILERMPLHNFLDENFEESLEKFIEMIFSNNLKIISITSMENVNKFEIETSSEYVELGFATSYEFILFNGDYSDHRIKGKMLNDFAESGADEFARLMTNCFGGPAMEVTEFEECYSIAVSYEFIQLLLANEPIIWMLRNHDIRVHCEDNSLISISDETITNFSPVINRHRIIWYVNFA